MFLINWYLFSLLCISAAKAIIDESKQEPRGILAKDGDFKYQALLYSNFTKSPRCGGAIINEWYILSSAHCVYPFRNRLDQLVVYLGTTDIENVHQVKQIAEIRIPSEFDNERKHHDIALIRVNKEIDFSEKVQPIQLPNGEPSVDSSLVTCGFGLRTVSSTQFKFSLAYSNCLQLIVITHFSIRVVLWKPLIGQSLCIITKHH